MTTPLPDSIVINATIGDLTTVPIGRPDDGNFGDSPESPSFPNANAPIQIIPGISSTTTAPDVIDAIITYLQKNSSLNLTRPEENLVLTMSNIYQAYLSSNNTLVNVIPFDDLLPTNIVTPINVSVNGGDIIRCRINGTIYGSITLPSFYPQQTQLVNEAIIQNDYLFITIKDPYRVSTNGTNINGTSYILTIAEVFIKNTTQVKSILNGTGVANTYVLEIVPAPSMGTTIRSTNTLTFYFDQDIIPSPFPIVDINGANGIISSNPINADLEYVSGIASLKPNSVVSVNYEIDNVIQTFYRNEVVSRLYPQTGTNFDIVNFAFSGSPVQPIVIASIIVMKGTSNAEIEPFIITLNAEALTSYNNFALDASLRKIYYDTRSVDASNNLLIRENNNPDVDFHARIKSRTNTFPRYEMMELTSIVSSDLEFNSKLVLDDNITTTPNGDIGFELQLQNGFYQFPDNCSVAPYNQTTTIFPISNEVGTPFDYSILNGDDGFGVPINTGYRWATFIINGSDITTPFIKNKNSLVLTINNLTNATGVATAPYNTTLINNFLIYIKFINIFNDTIPSNNCGYSQNGIFTQLPNGSAWFDCNKEGNLNTPIVDGDPIVDGTFVNTLSQKNISFGTRSYTGRVLVRVGIQKNSTIKFTSVSLN